MNSLRLGIFALIGSTCANAQDFLVLDNKNKMVVRVSGVDGSLVDPIFIDLEAGGINISTPNKIVDVGDEYWVTDVFQSRLYRYDKTGNYLGEIDGDWFNFRGAATADCRVFLGAAPTAGGYPELQSFDVAGNRLSRHGMGPANFPVDILNYAGQILISDAKGDDIDMWSFDGTYQGRFHNSDGVSGINTPYQMAIKSNGNLLVGGFDAPTGIYEYDPSGNEVNYIDTTAFGLAGIRGVAELDNGNLLFTNTDGIHVYDVGAGTVQTVLAVWARMATRMRRHGALGMNQCGPTVVNSSGKAGKIVATGSDAVADNALQLGAYYLPANEFAYFINSDAAGFVALPPGSSGNLCLGGAIGRHVAQVGSTGGGGTFGIQVDLTALPRGGGPYSVQPGDKFVFSLWFRDGASSNFTDAVCVAFH